MTPLNYHSSNHAITTTTTTTTNNNDNNNNNNNNHGNNNNSNDNIFIYSWLVRTAHINGSKPRPLPTPPSRPNFPNFFLLRQSSY